MKRTCVFLLLALSAACSEDPATVSTTEYVYPAPTGWAASVPGPESGEIRVGYWVPVGRSVRLYKVSEGSRLKITVSDGFGSGLATNGGRGAYEVRMNGGELSPRCLQARYQSNASALASGEFHHPYATVCITDALPAGLYEFDVWVQAVAGASYVGYLTGSPLIMAEELPTDGSYAFAPPPGAGEPFEFQTSATAWTKALLREVTHTKKSASTLLKVTLADTLRTGYLTDAGSGGVMVRLDGAETTCFAGKYDSQGTGADLHDPFVLTCILEGVAAGVHTFDVAIKAQMGAGAVGAADLGWGRSYPLLLVEELSAAGRSFVAPSGGTGEVSGAIWTSVGSRALTHAVGADGSSVKLTYSDNFRGAIDCAAAAGQLAIHLDGVATDCSLGQFSSMNGQAQNHHRPINLTCVFRDLAKGDHTFEVYSRSPCGSNMFGWGTGQSLLLAEELP